MAREGWFFSSSRHPSHRKVNGQGTEGVLFYLRFLVLLHKAPSAGRVNLKSCPLLAELVG